MEYIVGDRQMQRQGQISCECLQLTGSLKNTWGCDCNSSLRYNGFHFGWDETTPYSLTKWFCWVMVPNGLQWYVCTFLYPFPSICWWWVILLTVKPKISILIALDEWNRFEVFTCLAFVLRGIPILHLYSIKTALYTGSTMTTVDYMVYWTQLSSQDWKGVRHVLLLSSSGALVLVGWLAKKNFSISKLQSNILTLTDWPPFVNAAAAAATILPKGMREAIRPGPGCAGVSSPLGNSCSCWWANTRVVQIEFHNLSTVDMYYRETCVTEG